MSNDRVNRRQFVQAGTVAATALATGICPAAGTAGAGEVPQEVKNTRSYNPDMEYRRLGRTGIWVSAVCLGGHWKRIDKVIGAAAEINPYEGPNNEGDMSAFLKNRQEVVDRCIERGINCIDFAGNAEPETYCKVLEGRREEMYFCYSHPASELREPANCKAERLVELFEAGLKRCKIEYADAWRLMAMERGGRHSQSDVDAMVGALEIAKKKGLCRHTGLSTHDRRWAKWLIETYTDQIEMMCIPYTANSKELIEDSIFETVKKYDVGVLGIKPFASNALFLGDGSPDGPHIEEDNRRARLTIRYILCNPAITAPIPGMISPAQVDNMAAAIKERRELDEEEQADMKAIGKQTWDNLPHDYQWLKNWEYV